MKIQMWEIDKIHPYELNAKTHPPEQVKKIAESLKLGWDQPIVVDKNGVIIKGHGRRLAAIFNGYTKVPVLVRDDLDEDQVRAARLADNRVATSTVDSEILRQELESLNYDLKGIFDAKELVFAVADLSIMDESIFVTDLDAVVETHDASMVEQTAAAMDKRVSLQKVLGFKDIGANDQIFVTKLMAKIEGETGLKGGDALVAYAKQVTGA